MAQTLIHGMQISNIGNVSRGDHSDGCVVFAGLHKSPENHTPRNGAKTRQRKQGKHQHIIQIRLIVVGLGSYMLSKMTAGKNDFGVQ